MRAVLASGFVLLAVVIGYSASGSAAQAESSPAGLVVGDVVDITYPSSITGANLRIAWQVSKVPKDEFSVR